MTLHFKRSLLVLSVLACTVLSSVPSRASEYPYMFCWAEQVNDKDRSQQNGPYTRYVSKIFFLSGEVRVSEVLDMEDGFWKFVNSEYKDELVSPLRLGPAFCTPGYETYDKARAKTSEWDRAGKKISYVHWTYRRRDEE